MCMVCLSLFALLYFFPLAIVLSVLFRYTDSDYLFGIFKLFCCLLAKKIFLTNIMFGGLVRMIYDLHACFNCVIRCWYLNFNLLFKKDFFKFNVLQFLVTCETDILRGQLTFNYKYSIYVSKYSHTSTIIPFKMNVRENRKSRQERTTQTHRQYRTYTTQHEDKQNNKGNNKITEFRTIFQRESQNS